MTITPIEQAHLAEVIAQGRGRGLSDVEIAANLRATADTLAPSPEASIAAELRAEADAIDPAKEGTQ